MSLISWKYNIDGTWSNAADWSGGVLPGAGDDVLLNTRSYHTITYAASAGTTTIHSLTAQTDSFAVSGGTLTILAGASFAKNLTLSGGELALEGVSASVAGTLNDSQGYVSLGTTTTLSLSGPANFGGNYPNGATVDGGTLATSGTTTIEGYNGYGGYAGMGLGGGASWINSGTVDAASLLVTGDGAGPTATLTNLATGIFDLTTDQAGIEGGGYYNQSGGIQYGTSTFSNAGTLAKTGGSNVSSISSYFSNTGVIDAATGNIEFDGGGVFGGTLTGAGSISFGASSSNTLSAGAVVSVADLSVYNSATLTLAGDVADSDAVSIYNNGTLALATGASSFTGGFYQGGSGVLDLDGGTLTVLNATLGEGQATAVGPGTLSLAGTTALGNENGYTYYIQGGATLSNAGTVYQEQYIYFQDQYGAGNTVINQSGAAWDIVGNWYIYDQQYGADTFVNAGLLDAQAGQGYSDNIYAAVLNTGTIQVDSGTLEFDGGGTFGDTLTGAGQINFGGGSSTLTANAVLNIANLGFDGGTLTLGGDLAYAGNIILNNGDLTLAPGANTATGSFEQGNGTLTLNGGTLSLTNANLNNEYYSGGWLVGPGTLALAGTTSIGTGQGSTYYIYGGATVANSGTVALNQQMYFYDQYGAGSSFTNLAGASFDYLSDWYFAAGTTGADTFSNAGTYAKTGGTGTSDIQAAFINTGVISVATGTLDFSGGGTFAGTITGAGTIEFDSGTSTLTSIAVFNAASLYLSNGTLLLEANENFKSAQFSQYYGNLDLNGFNASVNNANLTYYGTLTGPGTLSLYGTTTIGNGNGYYYSLDGGATLLNTGVLNLNQNFYFDTNNTTGGTLANAAGATIDVLNNWQFYDYYGGPATINNAGLLAFTGGTNTTSDNVYTNSTGTVSVSTGTLSLTGGGSFAGTLTGAGTIFFQNNTYGFGPLTSNSGDISIYNSTLLLSGNTTLSGPVQAQDTSLYLSGNTSETLTIAGSLTINPQYYYYNDGMYVGGGSTLLTTGNTTIYGQNTSYSQFQVAGGATWLNSGTASLGGLLYLGDVGAETSGNILNEAKGVFDITADYSTIAQGYYTNSYGTQLSNSAFITNSGKFEKTGGTLTSYVYGTFTNTSTGTFGSTTGTLALEDGGSLSGLISDGSHVQLNGNFALNGLTAGGSVVVDNGNITATGALTLGDTRATVFDTYGTYTLQSGASIGTSTAAGSILYNFGLLETGGPAGHSTISAEIGNGGTLLAASGTLTLSGTVVGAGIMQIGAGATLEIGTLASSSAETATFLTNSGTLAFDSVATAKEHVGGFVAGDTIDLVNTAATSATLNSAGGLVIYNGSTALGTLALSGTHTGDVYGVASDGHGGTNITITSNTSTWRGNTGDWITGSVWANGIPGIGTNAVIAGTSGGTISLATTVNGPEVAYVNTLALSDAKATLALGGTLNIAQKFSQTAGTLNFSGTLVGGTLAITGGTDIWSGGLLDNTVEQGNISLTTAAAELGLQGSAAIIGAGSATPTITITGADANLYFYGNYTLNNTLIRLGSSTLDGGTFGGAAALWAFDPSGQGAILALGPQTTIVQSGLYAELADYNTAYDGIFNSGTITAATAGGTFTVFGNDFENDGIFNVSNGDDLNLDVQNFVNTGSLSVSGGTLTIGSSFAGGYFENDGSITTTNTAIQLNGTLTTAQLLSIYGTGDSFAGIGAYGELNNAGSTLTVGTGTAFGANIAEDGFITGGVIQDNGTGLVFVTGSNLSNLTYEGVLNLSQANAVTGIAGSFTMTGANGSGAGSINLTGTSSYLYFYDTMTLNNAIVSLGSAGDATLAVADNAGPDAVLTLGSQTVINTVPGSATLAMENVDATMVNDGTINVTSAGNTLNTSTELTIGISNIGTFINAGTIALSNGNTLNISDGTFTSTGTVTLNNATANIGGYITTASLDTFAPTNGSVLSINGLLYNNGNTLSVGTGTALGTLNLNGTISGGTIADAGGGIAVGGLAELYTVAYDGVLNITAANSILNLAGSNSFAGAGGSGLGTINLTGSNAQIRTNDNITLNNAVLNFGGANTSDTIYLYPVATSTDTLTLGTTLDLVQTAAGSADTINLYNYPSNSTFINQGTISATAAGGSFNLYNAYNQPAYFLNQGTLAVGNGEAFFVTDIQSVTNQGTFRFSGGAALNLSTSTLTNLASGTLTGGYYEADTGSTIQLANNTSITTLNATIALIGTGSTIESLNTSTNSEVTLESQLSNIGTAGVLNLAGGRNFSSTLNLSDNGGINLAGVSITENSVTTSKTGAVRGYGTLNATTTDNGTIVANGGTLTLSRTVTGIGSIGIAGSSTLVIGTTDTASGGVSFTGSGSALVLDTAGGLLAKIAGFTGNSLVLPNATISSASVSGTILTLNLGSAGSVSYTLTSTIAANKLAISSNGHTLTAYGNAAASGHSPEPAAFGNHHVGDSVSQALTLTNAAPIGAYENLDATLSGATNTGFTATGSFTGLAPGQSNSTSLLLGLNTATAGAIAGTASIALSSDGTGLDSAGITSLGTQTVNVSGAIYAYAAPNLSTTTLNFGATRLGGTLAAQTLTLGNGTVQNAYQESLLYALNPNANFSASSTAGTLASGSSIADTFALSTATAGSFTNTLLSVGLTSTGAGTSGLANTNLAPQTLTLNGQVYATAVAQLNNANLQNNVLNFGVVHVGDPASIATQAITVTNTATGALTDFLVGNLASITGSAFSGSSNTVSLAASASDTLSLALATTTSGSFTGSAALNFASEDSVLANLALAVGPITLQGTVDNYAVAALAEISGGGTLSQAGSVSTLNLGQIALGAAPINIALAAENAATGTADLLGGTLAASGSPAFSASGLGTFSGLGAGQADTAPDITLSTSTAGTFTETVTMASAGSNASGYAGTLATQTLSITGTIVGPETFTLPSTAVTLVGGPANNLFITTAADLLPADSLNGGTGSNTLSLTGGGTFNINALSLFENIGIIAATEGQAAAGAHPATNQVVNLPGNAEIVNVAAGTPATGNSNAETITINTGSASGTITLSTGYDRVNAGSGSETIEIGSYRNTVAASSGSVLAQAAIANANASVYGTATTGAYNTALEITSGGTVVLNNADTYLNVKLDDPTLIITGTLGFITVNGGNGGDTLHAGGANQIFVGGAGDSLIGYVSGSTEFMGASSALTGDKIFNWNTGDVIDITNMNFNTLQPLTYASGLLKVNDGTNFTTLSVSGTTALGLHNFTVAGSDGNGGTLIDFHS